MKTKLATLAIAIAALSSCSTIARYLPENEDGTVSSYRVTPGCDVFDVSLTGWPEGTVGVFGLGSTPPWPADPINGSFHRVIPTPDYPAEWSVGWSILIRTPDGVETSDGGAITCR